MKRLTGSLFGVLLLALACPLSGQQSVTPYPANDLEILAPQLSVPGAVTATYSGPQGADQWSYWVVAAYVGGSSGLSQPANLTNVGPLSVSNTVVITWQRQTNATGYTVLRSPRNMQPSNGCACVVASVAGSVGTATDSGAALTNWTQAAIGGPTLLQTTVNNRDYPFPRLIQTLPRGFWDRDERDFAWKIAGRGTLAQRPVTCEANHDVYICNGTGCPGSLAAYYCTATDIWTILSGGGSTVTNFNVINQGPIVNLPATCNVGDVFVCNGAGCKGNFRLELYYCTALNTFEAITGGSGDILISEATINNQATVDLSNIFTSEFELYRIDFLNMVPATNDQELRMLFESGGTFQVTNYVGKISAIAFNGIACNDFSIATYIGLSGCAGAALFGISNTTTGGGGSGTLWVANPAATDRYKGVYSTHGVYSGGGGAGQAILAETSSIWNNVAAVTGVRFLMSSGNITSGIVRVWAIPTN